MPKLPNNMSVDNDFTPDHDDQEFRNKRALDFIEHLTVNADEIQTRVLTEIISCNANVEYLQRHGLKGGADRGTFKRVVPVVGYEDLVTDIERIANGDKSPILCSTPISEFLTSSGTSGGERKLMPTIEEEMERKCLLFSLVMPVMAQFIPGLDMDKGMYFLFIKSESKTPGGLVARPVLTSYLKSRQFMSRPFDPYTNYTSPNETILCSDSTQSLYSQLLCGLIQSSQVLRVGSIFASGFIRAIKFLEKNWELLCQDIRIGSLNPRIITDPSVKESVMKILRPDLDLADKIEAECKKGSWRGIITRLWPNTKCIEVIVTGTMAQYIPTLDYYGNGLPLVCTIYASSECFFGINLNPICDPSEVKYTLLPNMGYFEFLPVNRDGGKEELVDLVDVKVGEEYELVVTTYAGLYRYRVGDILRVAGFKNKAPQFTFLRRKNVALSVDSDKTNEVELQNAVKNATNHLNPFGASLLEYTSSVDTSTIPGHYVLFWEIYYTTIATQKIPTSVLEECCLTIEESLNSVYRQGRSSDKSIGPLEIRVVEGGTFDKLMDWALNHGASINQYKTPRCVKYGPIIDLLNSRVVSRYFSPKCPKWVPGHKQWCTN